MYGVQQGNPPSVAKPMVDCDKKSQALFAKPNMLVFTVGHTRGGRSARQIDSSRMDEKLKNRHNYSETRAQRDVRSSVAGRESFSLYDYSGVVAGLSLTKVETQGSRFLSRT